MVVNMGSLASTLMLVAGAVSLCGRAAGGGGSGADLTFCAWLDGAAERNKNKPAAMARPGFASKVLARTCCCESLSGTLAALSLAFLLLRCIHFQSNVGPAIRQGSPALGSGSLSGYPIPEIQPLNRTVCFRIETYYMKVKQALLVASIPKSRGGWMTPSAHDGVPFQSVAVTLI